MAVWRVCRNLDPDRAWAAAGASFEPVKSSSCVASAFAVLPRVGWAKFGRGLRWVRHSCRVCCFQPAPIAL
eukprot:4639757-Lingulodinium_polyedra.AAC.1